MKRNIIEKIFNLKKIALTVILTGLALTSTGFADGDEIPVEPESVPIEQVSANEPTTISVGENGRLQLSEDDEINRMFVELVEESRQRDVDKLTGKDVDDSAELEISTVEVPPENIIETVNGNLVYVEAIDMEATAYLPTDGGSAGLTATGIPATFGIVAVDPYVIPLGTRVYIPGYGEALAADTGGAICGNRIDLCMESYWQAMDFGRRMVTVFVLK